MSKMMDKWFQRAKPGDKDLTRPPASGRVSGHKNEVRSIDRGYFQIQFSGGGGGVKYWSVDQLTFSSRHTRSK